MNFKDTWAELDKLQEWKYMNPPVQSQNTNTKKTYEITYTEDGVKKSFTVQAGSKAEATQIGWATVDADDIYVDEVN